MGNDTRIPGIQDAQLTLQNTTTQAATLKSAPLDMGVGFAPGGSGKPVLGIIGVSAVDLAKGSYIFKLQESATTVDGDFVDISLPVSVSATGTLMCKGFLSLEFVRLVMTATAVAGGPPAITYDGSLNPIVVA